MTFKNSAELVMEPEAWTREISKVMWILKILIHYKCFSSFVDDVEMVADDFTVSRCQECWGFIYECTREW